MSKTPLKISSGSVTVPVQMDDGPIIDITFNPNDKAFAERLHAIYFDAKEKIKEIEALEAKEPEKDENGMPLEIDSVMVNYDEINRWFHEKLDLLLGEGISEKVFGDTVYTGERMDVYVQLLTGLFSVVNPKRQNKVKKHVRK